MPLIAMMRLYHRTMGAMRFGFPREALVAPQDYLIDPEVFPELGTGQELVLDPESRVAGFHLRRSNEELVAIWRERLGYVFDGLADM